MSRVLAGTKTGLYSFGVEAADRRTELDGHDVWAVAPVAWKTLWAIVDQDEIWRRDDLTGWSSVASLADLGDAGLQAGCLADTRANDEGGILVGTSRAHLLRVAHDRLEKVESFEQAPGRDAWYTPWGGPPAVRSITENRASVFVNVHVGGVLRTRDGGATWQPTIEIDADVHRVVTGKGRVYAAGAGGLSISEDDGDTWRLSARGLHASYCRSVAVCGEALLLSAADGPGGGRSAVYRTDLRGAGFERSRGGLPEWFGDNIDSLCLDSLPDGSLAAFGTASGEVFVSRDQGSTWSELAAGLASIRSVLVLPQS